MWPPDDELIATWRHLVADPDTAGAFAAVVLPPLVTDLARFFPGRDPDDLATATGDAVLAFLRRPAAFDPSLRPLPVFLRFIARRKLFSLHKREQRHHDGRIPWESVELSHPAGNDLKEGECLTDHPAVRAAVDAMSEDDRRVLDLMRDGERDNVVFAEVLGITDRPADEQATVVKRTKDRIKVRLKRAVEES